MFRFLSFYTSSVQTLTWFGVFYLLSACSTRPDDVVPAAYPLQKGQTLNSPAIISEGLKEFDLISVNTSQDKILARLSANRPQQIGDYSNSKLYPNQSIIDYETNLSQHVFSWNSTKRKVMMIALFKQVIQVADNQIANPQDIVWLWTPPANSTDPGNTAFGSGKMVSYKDGKFILSDVPKISPVLPGLYVWAVWAWDDKAINIVAASRELPLQVIP